MMKDGGCGKLMFLLIKGFVSYGCPLETMQTFLGHVSEWSGDGTETSDEATIEVRKSQKALELLDVRG